MTIIPFDSYSTISAILLIFLAIGILYVELKLKHFKNPIIRGLMWFTSVILLGFLLFRPTKHEIARSLEARLIKHSQSNSSKNDLPEYIIYIKESNSAVNPTKVKAYSTHKLKDINLLQYSISTIEILPDQFSADELSYINQFAPITIRPYQSSLADVFSFEFSSKLIAGDSLYFHLRYPSDDTLSIKIDIDQLEVDSTRFIRNFQYKTATILSGERRLQFKVFKQDTLIIRHEMDMQVIEPPLYKIVLLQSSPSADLNFLTRIISNQNHQLSRFIQLSQSQLASSFFNTESAMSLTKSIAEAEIIISEYSYYKNNKLLFDRVIKQPISSSFRQLIILPDETLFTEGYQHMKFSKYTSSLDEQLWHYQLASISLASQSDELIHVPDNSFLVTFPLRKLTYRSALLGDTLSYANYWSTVLRGFNTFSNAMNSIFIHPETNLIHNWTPSSNDLQLSVYDLEQRFLVGYTNKLTALGSTTELKQNKYFKKPLGKWLVFLLLLIFLTYLWISEKW
jgi:hypothetical protein